MKVPEVNALLWILGGRFTAILDYDSHVTQYHWKPFILSRLFKHLFHSYNIFFLKRYILIFTVFAVMLHKIK